MTIQKTVDPFGKDFSHLRDFPDHVLLDIARNGSAQHEYRLLSVEILLGRNSPKIKHPDIQDLVRELEIELDGIVFENPAPTSGAMTASITTKTMQEGEVVDMEVLRELTTPKLSEETEPAIDNLSPEVEKLDVPPTESTSVPTEPRPRRARKPKEPVNDPQPE